MPTVIAIPLAAIPLIPDGDDARRQAERELAKSAYQAARPTFIDQWARAVVDFVNGLFSEKNAVGLGPWAAIVIGALLAAVLIAVLVIWGRPRLSQTRSGGAVLLGAANDRTAAQLRAEAERAAGAADWPTAIVLRYRALARALLERDLIAPAPGATAQAIAREAAAPFPGLRDELHAVAMGFDDVRYLGGTGDAAQYRSVAEMDDRIGRTRPQEDVAESTSGRGSRVPA